MSGATLITGGAGFIGTNLADALLTRGERVIVYDNLSRRGVAANAAWLAERHRGTVQILDEDIRDATALRRAVAGASQVYHLAAQVAVTTSLEAPEEDAHVNLTGTLNVLEAIRAQRVPPAVVFTSTNKVYGNLPDVELDERATRYEPSDARLRAAGIDEQRPLRFCTPYGCSKGAADQYVLDYAHSYGIAAVVFRMSCIYGPHQFGNEDQGWVAHFLIRALQDAPITIYGDGKQVRDVLFVTDLVDALLRAQRGARRLAGHAFNIGGGPRNCLSLRELLGLIEQLCGERPEIERGPWRQGDQRYYVSDTRAFQALTGWRPTVSPARGVNALHDWLSEYGEAVPASARAA